MKKAKHSMFQHRDNSVYSFYSSQAIELLWPQSSMFHTQIWKGKGIDDEDGDKSNLLMKTKPYLHVCLI